MEDSGVVDECEVEFNYELIDDKFAEWNKETLSNDANNHQPKMKLSLRRKKTMDALVLTDIMVDIEEQQQPNVVVQEVKKSFEQEHTLTVMVCLTFLLEMGTILQRP